MRDDRSRFPAPHLAGLALTLGVATGGCTGTDPAASPAGEREAGSAAALEPFDLWAGVPALEARPGDQAEVLEPRPGPARPPSAGEGVTTSFPSSPASGDPPAATPATGPLAVERYGPRGAPGLVDAVTVTFSEPMVPLAAVQARSTPSFGLEVQPSFDGFGRWLSTRTYVLQALGRIPYSTTYEVTVAQGVTSVHGHALPKPLTWTFTTPVLAVRSASPSGTNVDLEPTLRLEFNQPIARAPLLAALKLRGAGQTVALNALSLELDDDATAAQRELAARTIQLRPRARLRTNTRYTLSLPAGVFGEGPNKSPRLEHAFSTYPPLKLSVANCGDPCWAENPIVLDTTTPIRDPKLSERITVTPAVDNLSVRATARAIEISGTFDGRRRYAIKVDGATTDTFGQTLGKEFRASVLRGPLVPSLAIAGSGPQPAVIERSSSPELTLRVAGVDDVEVLARTVQPTELAAFGARPSLRNGAWPPERGQPSFARTFDLSPSRSRRQSLALPLHAILGDETSRGSIGWMLARTPEFELWGRPQRHAVARMFEVTDLGVAAALDSRRGIVAVHRLSSSEPVAGATVQLVDAAGATIWSGTTDPRGMAEPAWEGRVPHHVLVLAEDDAAYLPARGASLGGGARLRPPNGDRPRVFFFTDRTPYKPGETLHLVGILREEEARPDGGVGPWQPEGTGSYRVTTPRGLEVARGDVEITRWGSFALDIGTDEEHGTGNFDVQVTLPSRSGRDLRFHHAIPVETYRTPDFGVEIQRPNSAALIYGDRLTAEVRARYLHGAPMVGAAVRFNLTRSDRGFTPPGALHRDFRFGTHPQWGHFPIRPSPPPQRVAAGSGRTSARGTFQLSHALAATDSASAQASTYVLTATVTAENRQAISHATSFIVHPAELYVGLRTDRTVLAAGEPVTVEAVAVDPEGERLAGRDLEVQLLHRETTRTAVQQDGRWRFAYDTRDEPISRCRLTSRGVPVGCAFEVGRAGTYIVQGTARDAKGRSSRSELSLYVHGDTRVVWGPAERRVDVVPDRSRYEPDDTATVLVRSPFDQASGLLLVEREGIAAHKVLQIQGGTAVVQLPLKAAWAPGVTVSAMVWQGRVEVPGTSAGEDLGMPAAAAGSVGLEISNRDHRIAVEVSPHVAEIEPGGSLTVDVETRDAGGNPIAAGIALMVVDEGVLSLMDHSSPDPLSFFIRARDRGAWMQALHTHVVPRQPGAPSFPPLGPLKGSSRAQPAFAPGGPVMLGAAALESATAGEPGLGHAGTTPQAVALRTSFASTAYFNGALETDEAGHVRVTFEMPDNLTTFRVMAVAVGRDDADRFGSGDAQVQVRKAVMLRPSLPRFVNLSDTFEASVTVDNQTGTHQQILVGTRGLNVVVDDDDTGLVDVPAGTSKEVRFGLQPKAVGTMRIQFAAMSPEGRDATELELPVHTPATAEIVADYGVTDNAIVRTLQPPTQALPTFGGFDLSVSSTALSGLQDAVQHLVNAPYECAEQTASRLLPIFALGDVLDDFPLASTADPARRDRLARSGIDDLLAKQNPDGGFASWRAGDSQPHVSTWATLALLEGKRAGFAVDEAKLASALRYVESFARSGRTSRFGRVYDWTTRALGVWLLSREGRGEDAFAAVWAQRTALPLFARAHLMSAAQAYGKAAQRNALLKQVRAAAVQSASTIHFAESRAEAEGADGLRVLMHSNPQTDAAVLMALLDVAPADPMVPKVMAGLMASRDPRRGGRWASTHTSAWALLAAARYFKAVEAETPAFTARAWLGDSFAAEFAFDGRSMIEKQHTIPMPALVGAPTRSLTLSKQGPGTMYYRLGLRYAPSGLARSAHDRGFSVTRRYTALPATGEELPDPTAVQQLEDGSWVIKAGTTVKVELSIEARDRAYYVVIDDPLPAGFEGVNPKSVTQTAQSLAGNAGTQPETQPGWWHPRWRFDHTDLRDDRMLLFADRLPAGVYTYAYTARATTVGDFYLPPTRAEAMYQPERSGQTGSLRVRVVQ